MAPRTKQSDDKSKHIEYGSSEHAALLGIETERDPQIKAAKEEALTTVPTPTPNNPKTPISRRHTEPETEILDGWSRRRDI